MFSIKPFSTGFNINYYYNIKLLDMFNFIKYVKWIFQRGSQALTSANCY